MKGEIVMSKRRAVFLDRDGVINKMVERGDQFMVGGKRAERTAPFFLEELSMCDGVAEALGLLGEMSFLRILVSNQPDIFYGLLSRTEHKKIMERVRSLDLEDVFICFHGRDEGCVCRKPQPGMLHDAALRWGIDLTRSYMIGDSSVDLEAARAVGCQGVLIRTSYNQDVIAQYEAPSLLGAVRLIRSIDKIENNH